MGQSSNRSSIPLLQLLATLGGVIVGCLSYCAPRNLASNDGTAHSPEIVPSHSDDKPRVNTPSSFSVSRCMQGRWRAHELKSVKRKIRRDLAQGRKGQFRPKKPQGFLELEIVDNEIVLHARAYKQNYRLPLTYNTYNKKPMMGRFSFTADGKQVFPIRPSSTANSLELDPPIHDSLRSQVHNGAKTRNLPALLLTARTYRVTCTHHRLELRVPGKSRLEFVFLRQLAA